MKQVRFHFSSIQIALDNAECLKKIRGKETEKIKREATTKRYL